MQQLLFVCTCTTSRWKISRYNIQHEAGQIESNGYPAEVHYATTEDGYILKMFRIPRGKRSSLINKPILIMHGLLCSSDCWTIGGPQKALAYILADNGYDVWLGNSRGNTYSRSHLTIPNNDPKFWDFSMHEQGYYDLPAMIDLIRAQTGEYSVSYIGHSQGATIFFVMASMRPEYQDKITVAVQYAPVAFLNYGRGIIPTLSTFSSTLATIGHALRINSFLHNNILIRWFGNYFCSKSSPINWFCWDLMFAIAGVDTSLINKMPFDEVTRYCPTGASVKQIDHFVQLTKNGGYFRQFDYGPVTNLVKYGSATPPEYPLEAITVPMVLVSAENDSIATMPEVAQLIRKLKNVKAQWIVADGSFNHVDFMWNPNVTSLVYDTTISQITQFRSSFYQKMN
ncbi:unnamed protein product [Nesidiocoris tenuis]|uniref:Lipase n=1 Tax=Nesidiocoris tenuis TaxID=355587 RepID=A0A6H5GJ62_9HEMI|nr:unnamed protein product [Nesidiocoris tenuis]